MTTTFERRQKLLRILEERPGIKVKNLADLLEVSEGTIRNDLDALEKETKVRRVRGGAVLVDAADRIDFWHADPETDGKQRIGRRAAEMMTDGDAIFMDDSTTVRAMIPFMRDYRRLTIITNGLETARLLAGTTNTVILIGGVVSTTGRSTSTLMGISMLNGLHIQTAFVSGNGFAPEVGLTERQIEEAALKKEVLARSGRVVALMTSSRLNQISTTPFAPTARLSDLVTDADVPKSLQKGLWDGGVNLIICGQNTLRTYMVKDQPAQFTIGFANQSERLPFAVDVRRGIERAAGVLSNIDLVVADNKLSGEEALRVADRLIQRDIDLVIEYQIDYTSGSQIINKFQQQGIPVIAVDIPMVGATFFGVDNYKAGYMAGEALGTWVCEAWQGEIDFLFVLEEPRAGSLPEARIQGQLDSFQSKVGEIPAAQIVKLDSGNRADISKLHVQQALEEIPAGHRIAVVSFNDEAAWGALQAARALDREQDVVIVGQGGDRLVRDEIRDPHSRLIGSTAYRPEAYGERVLELAQKILRGESVPPAVYIEHVFLTSANIDLYYPQED
ncbi:MAG: substrate-binding domain-containing protein [Ardenticatenaceae bacterium]|nr:substrate-binding domain-containing protein [Ardenticatenaceae bacterium]